ncbi:MAG: cytidine deaminase [Nitrososphaerota archaeon]|nr:cytidine deaminase [Nitrososphaerota archaeon]
MAQPEQTEQVHDYASVSTDQKKLPGAEIIIGLVGAIGTDLDNVTNVLKKRLNGYAYTSSIVKVSEIILKFSEPVEFTCEYDRLHRLINWGNELREKTGDAGFLAKGVAKSISEVRKGLKPIQERRAFIIKSLKNAEEVKVLRKIYGNGFYLIGVYSDKKMRLTNLTDGQITEEDAEKLIKRDEDEKIGHGQHTRDTFQMADFFIDYSDEVNMRSYIHRILDLIFGHPHHTPTVGEYAMFMAFCASLRSADLSRQIGAAICLGEDIIATGVNDCPKYGGGLYWQYYDANLKCYCDAQRGKDYQRGEDPNKAEIQKIAKKIVGTLKELPENSKISRIADTFKELSEESETEFLNILKRPNLLGGLTEFNRAVHAEMEALIMCARNNISCKGADMYVTTFPCHACAKHIIAAGIKTVVYIEPYPKSKTFELFDDSTTQKEGGNEKGDKVLLVPFFGVGPRKFIEMFSMKFGTLEKKIRKDVCEKAVTFDAGDANIRDPLSEKSYLEREKDAVGEFCEVEINLGGKCSTIKVTKMDQYF